MRKAGDEEIQKALTGGIVFKKVSERPESSGVKTKAKKKQYITGAHGSAAAKKIEPTAIAESREAEVNVFHESAIEKDEKGLGPINEDSNPF